MSTLLIRLYPVEYSEFLKREMSYAKHISICYVGGGPFAYSKKAPFRYNRVVQATTITKEMMQSYSEGDDKGLTVEKWRYIY